MYLMSTMFLCCLEEGHKATQHPVCQEFTKTGHFNRISKLKPFLWEHWCSLGLPATNSTFGPDLQDPIKRLIEVSCNLCQCDPLNMEGLGQMGPAQIQDYIILAQQVVLKDLAKCRRAQSKKKPKNLDKHTPISVSLMHRLGSDTSNTRPLNP